MEAKLVFKDNKKRQSEKKCVNIKMVLANKIAKNMQYFSKEEIIKNIDIAHRVTTCNKNSSVTPVPPFLVTKFANCDMSEKIKSVTIKAER